MKLTLRLNPDSADEVLNEIQLYRDQLIRAVQELGAELATVGAEYMRASIIWYDAVESGELLSSVEGFFDPVTGRGYVACRSGHAAFVEYGTGVVGENPGGTDSRGLPYTTKPYSLAETKPSGWHYDVNHHGEAGWTYQGGRWTRGQPPRPFVYETYLRLKDLADEAKMRILNNG